MQAVLLYALATHILNSFLQGLLHLLESQQRLANVFFDGFL